MSTIDDEVPIVAMVLRSGGDFDYKYVNALSSAIRRNSTVECEIVCFTDNSDNILVDDMHVDRIIPLKKNFPKWWCKIEMFEPNLFEDGRQIIYFDLDTVICNNIDFLLNVDAKFAGIRDLFHPVLWQSGVMAWKANGAASNEIYNKFIKQPNKIMEHPSFRGDANWIRHIEKGTDFLQDRFPGAIVSYKVASMDHIIKHKVPIVCFHGKPRPHEVNVPYISQNWVI